MSNQTTYKQFDLKLASECARSFHHTSSLGCAVTDGQGASLDSIGYSCNTCQICALAGVPSDTCIHAHIHGMTEAERFGGKYIYFCPMGLTCFVSPIIGDEHAHAKITVGPFLMVERDDYISIDIEPNPLLTAKQKERIASEVARLPVIEASKVTSLSNLLFMAVGFLNNVSASARMLEKQSSEEIQGQINEYVAHMKRGDLTPAYPIELEQRLLRAISKSDRETAAQLLNDLLGHIFFCTQGDFVRIKSSLYELLILVSRATIHAGSDSEKTLALSHGYLNDISNIQSIDALCLWFTNVVGVLMEGVFDFSHLRHSDAIYHVVQYMHGHYAEKISLEDAAKAVYLSPTYLSRIFKQETGISFNRYLNNIRVEKSKTLLISNQVRLADIAPMVGFEDQSYYTKVFKRTTGMLPSLYRDKNHSIT